MKRFCYLLCLLLFACNQNKSVIVSGRILGFDGQPVIPSCIRIWKDDIVSKENRKKFETDSLGHFSFELPSTGAYHTTICAPRHNTIIFPLFLDSPTNTLNIQMESPVLQSNPEAIYLTGDLTTRKNSRQYLLMKNKSGGIYALKVATPADTFAYQVKGMYEKDVDIPGTQYDYYTNKQVIYSDQPGYFVSVVRTPEDSAVIELDLHQLKKQTGEQRIQINGSESASQKVVDWHNHFQTLLRDYSREKRKQVNQGVPPEKIAINKTADSIQVMQGYLDETDEVVKSYIILNSYLLFASDTDSVSARKILREVAPVSHAWTILDIFRSHIIAKIDFSGADSSEIASYFQRISWEHPDNEVKADFLFRLFMDAKFGHQPEVADSLYQIITTTYAHTNSGYVVKMNFPAHSSIVNGKKCPAFRLKLMDSDDYISNETLSGRYVLIDFWASWCGPCKQEMKYLHEAFEAFKNKNFTILSLSLDRSEKDVQTFRNDQWAMPWLHCLLSDSVKKEFTQRFEVSGIPKPILINDEGIIIVSGGENLRGEKLKQVLSAYLEN